MALDKAFYTKGSIGKMMFKTALAMLAGTVALSFYQIVDTFFVGKLGTGPLAAMGFTLPVVMICGCVFRGVYAGIMTLCAQAIGSSDHKRAEEIVNSGFYLALTLSIVLAVLGKWTAPIIFVRLGAEGETLMMVLEYMDIWFLGVASGMLGLLGGDLLITVGDTKMASLTMILGTVLNMILDYLMIFGHAGFPCLGIKGAALATVIAQAISLIVSWSLLWKKYEIIKWKPLPLSKMLEHWKKELRFGFPVMLGSVIMPLGQTVVTRAAANFGDAAVAAIGAVNRLESLAFMVPMSVGFALTPMAGQNYGAGLYDRLKRCYKIANTFAFTYLLVVAAILCLVAPLLVAQFSEDPDVSHLMRCGLYIISWGFGLLEIHRYSTFFLTGCGRPGMGASLNIFRVIILHIPLTLLAVYFDKVLWLFWGRLIADVIAGLTSLFCSGLMIWKLSKKGEICNANEPL